jgi:hypothetical protein
LESKLIVHVGGRFILVLEVGWGRRKGEEEGWLGEVAIDGDALGGEEARGDQNSIRRIGSARERRASRDNLTSIEDKATLSVRPS